MSLSEPTSYKVEPALFDSVITPPSSKSYSNRALICAAFSQDEVRVLNLSDSSDVVTLVACLKKIGVVIEKKDQEWLVKNSFPECEKVSEEEIILETGDGGTTNRFLLALLALGKNKYVLKTSYGMKKRPMGELITALREIPVNVEINDENITIQGPPPKKFGRIEVDCSKSSQFASALLMAFPTAHLVFNNLNTSKKYFDMTRLVSREIAQKRLFEIPYDWSSLSYPIALGVTLGKVVLKNVKLIDELQADSTLMKVLRGSGAKISRSDDGLVVEKSDLKPFDVDCQDCPDLVPTLAFIASTIKGESKLKNIKVLKYKESDRLRELFHLFDEFKVPYQYNENEDTLTLEKGSEAVEFVTYKAPDDHRMIMTAYLFMRYHNGGDIFNYRHIEKSFPHFFKEMES